MSLRLTTISCRKFERFLERVGCTFSRQKGSHRIRHRPGLRRPLVIPADEVSPQVIKSNLKTLGISTKEYLKIMQELWRGGLGLLIVPVRVQSCIPPARRGNRKSVLGASGEAELALPARKSAGDLDA